MWIQFYTHSQPNRNQSPITLFKCPYIVEKKIKPGRLWAPENTGCHIIEQAQNFHIIPDKYKIIKVSKIFLSILNFCFHLHLIFEEKKTNCQEYSIRIKINYYFILIHFVRVSSHKSSVSLFSLRQTEKENLSNNGFV